MTVGKLPRLFCLVQCNVLHLHAFAVWCNLCLCVVCVYTNLLLILTLLEKQCQWKSVPKVLLCFSLSSSLLLGVLPSQSKTAHSFGGVLLLLFSSTIMWCVFHINSTSYPAEYVHKSRCRQCALVYSVSQEEYYKAYFSLQSNNTFKSFSQIKFNALLTLRHMFRTAVWGWDIAMWGITKPLVIKKSF